MGVGISEREGRGENEEHVNEGLLLGELPLSPSGDSSGGFM